VTIDDGTAISYTALPTGVPVYDSAEAEVGTLRKVLDNAREHIFDGIEVERRDGVHVFVDAPEVARTAERGVTLTITGQELDAYPPVKAGIKRLFGR
jgi:hypothetical protein